MKVPGLLALFISGLGGVPTPGLAEGATPVDRVIALNRGPADDLSAISAALCQALSPGYSPRRERAQFQGRADQPFNRNSHIWLLNADCVDDAGVVRARIAPHYMTISDNPFATMETWCQEILDDDGVPYHLGGDISDANAAWGAPIDPVDASAGGNFYNYVGYCYPEESISELGRR